MLKIMTAVLISSAFLKLPVLINQHLALGQCVGPVLMVTLEMERNALVSQ